MNNEWETAEKSLSSLCRSAGLIVTEGQRHVLLNYLRALMEMNSKLNLTRIVEPSQAVRLHIVDSLLCLPEVFVAPAGPLCDVGTGGGLPGVPLCVVSGRRGTLLDSVGKKARAVDEILHGLALDGTISALPLRSEQHALTHGHRYAVVTARAVSSLPALVEMAAPLLSDDGVLVALKGSPSADEISRGSEAAALVGLRQVSDRSLVLPGGDEVRTVITYRRFGKAKLNLPRRPGQAHIAPLA